MSFFILDSCSGKGSFGASWRVLVLIALLGPFLLVSSNAAQPYEIEVWDGSLPSTALVAGLDSGGAEVFICVASSWDGQHPGMLDSAGLCHVAWGGQGHEFSGDFSVVTDAEGGGGQWVHMPDGGIAGNAFAAGTDGGPIFVCRVTVDGGVQIGKVADDGWCFVGAGDEEIKFTSDFEVLVE